MLYPLLWMLASSFKPESDIFSSASLWPRSFSLDAYWRGWSGSAGQLRKILPELAAGLVVSASSATWLSCSLTAYAFARLKFRGQNFWFALMLGTLMLPYHVTLIPQYILFLNLGWVDTFLPLIVPKFLAADAFFIFLLVQFFRSIPARTRRSRDDRRLRAMADLLDRSFCRCRCRRLPPPRSSPSSGPGMTSSGRSSISTT